MLVAKRSRSRKPSLKVVQGGDQPPGSAAPQDGMTPESNDTEDDAAERAEQEERKEAARERDDELCNDVKIREKVIDLMKDVAKGFEQQWDRGNDQKDYWDIYDLVPSPRQAYSGNSMVYLPIVWQAIEARITRFVNQIFPRSQRSVDCISSDEKPFDIMALLEHYIRKARLRTQVMPALMRNGDVEGQYNLYVSWENSSRYVVYRTKPKIEIGGEEGDEPEEVDDPTADDEDYDVEEVETFHMSPVVEVLADADVCVLPHTANSVGEALAKGGSATVIRRWSKARLEKAIDDGEIDKDVGEELETLFGAGKEDPGAPGLNKQHVDAAGITTGSGGGKELHLYETWTILKVDGNRRLCRIYYAGTKSSGTTTEEMVASVKRNPYWNDKCPILSAPAKKISNVFKGRSQVKPVADLQYSANDTFNEGMDSAAYALMPIVMTDPVKNPRVGSMVLNLAAIWETNPNDTKFAQFPALWKDALTIIAQIKTEIFQILSVSPAMMPQSSGSKGGKRNQAEIALEQQVDVLSTADVSTNVEDEILTPLLRWFVDLDYQFRDKPITIKQFGQMGLRAQMVDVPILENSRRYEFRWWGVEAARSAQQQQIQVSAINVIKGLPPDSYQGYKLNMVPFILQLVESAFGARLTPEVFTNLKDQLTLPAEQENEYLVEGLDLPVHELDEDQEHMKIHLKAMVQGDPHGSVRQHLLHHRMQMNKKMQMAAASLAGMQGSPGGGGQPGAAGSPRPGAQPMPPRGGQQPAGAIHKDQMQDPAAAPRR
jgi:hypothetical protein